MTRPTQTLAVVKVKAQLWMRRHLKFMVCVHTPFRLMAATVTGVIRCTLNGLGPYDMLSAPVVPIGRVATIPERIARPDYVSRDSACECPRNLLSRRCIYRVSSFRSCDFLLNPFGSGTAVQLRACWSRLAATGVTPLISRWFVFVVRLRKDLSAASALADKHTQFYHAVTL